MESEIKGTIVTEEIKRCYIKGAIFKEICPKCKNEMITDLGDDYLSYPENNSEQTIGLYCEKCDLYYSLLVKFSSEVKLKIIGGLMTE